MVIQGDGAVGIGTSKPGAYKLAVNGNIHAKEIKIDVDAVNWPDFVFDKKYEILPLSLLEQFIIKNKHLPEIPSAKEVGENGVNIGEMNIKLLRKVEELTLYLIEQDKKIEDLQKRISKN